MGQGIRKPAGAHEVKRVSLGELIHQHVPIAIETAVHEELLATLGATPYERSEARRGYRNGTKERTLIASPEYTRAVSGRQAEGEPRPKPT